MMKRQSLEKGIGSAGGRVFFGGLLLFLSFMLFLPAGLFAAAPQVICVPQVPSDLLVPHDTWSGEPTILKGIAKDDDGDLIGGTYYWEYGDGDESVLQAIANPDNLAATHTYTANQGTLFIARLYVTDAAGESSSDDYRLIVRQETLDVEINKAIDDGLWWLYTHREAVSSYSIIPNQALFTSNGNPGLLGEYFNNTSFSGDPVLTRIDPEINFYWGSSPGSGINSNNFSVRWTGTLHIPADGYYSFASCNDDGTRLYVDGNLLINDWTGHAPAWCYSSAVYLTAGEHGFQVDCYEGYGGAQAKIYWSPTVLCRWNNIRYGNHYANSTASGVQAYRINGHL